MQFIKFGIHYSLLIIDVVDTLNLNVIGSYTRFIYTLRVHTRLGNSKTKATMIACYAMNEKRSLDGISMGGSIVLAKITTMG